MTVPAVTDATTPPPSSTRMARIILENVPAPRHSHAFVDAGATAVGVMTLALFIAPMAFWVVEIAGPGSGASAGFETRMLLLSVLLALLLPLLQIYLQITRFGALRCGAIGRGSPRAKAQRAASPGRIAI